MELGGVGSIPRCLGFGREAAEGCKVLLLWVLVPVWPASRDFGILTLEGDCCVAKATSMLETGREAL